MRYESERRYVTNPETIDDPSRWGSESGYFRGLGEDEASSWVDAFKEVLPAVASVYQQDQFNKMNIALINAGKPPVSAAQYMASQPPTVTVGPTPEAQKYLMYGAIGLLAIVGLRAAKVI